MKKLKINMFWLKPIDSDYINKYIDEYNDYAEIEVAKLNLEILELKRHIKKMSKYGEDND